MTFQAYLDSIHKSKGWVAVTATRRTAAKREREWAVPRAGGFNAEVWGGWMNRLVVATYLAWQLAVACCLIAIRKAP